MAETANSILPAPVGTRLLAIVPDLSEKLSPPSVETNTLLEPNEAIIT